MCEIVVVVRSNILKLIIGLTIFRRWRAVHGAEEHPSPSGFAMVFQKAPFSPKSNANKAKNSSAHPSGSVAKETGAGSTSSGGGGGTKSSKSVNTSVVNNNVQATGCAAATPSEGFSKMVIFYKQKENQSRIRSEMF